MISVLRRQHIITDQQQNEIAEFPRIFTAFLREANITFELIGADYGTNQISRSSKS
jgi:hypothetical protein